MAKKYSKKMWAWANKKLFGTGIKFVSHKEFKKTKLR
jgi:hypothetical protein